MPELPEVETICRGLAPQLGGRAIVQCEAYRKDLRFPMPDKLAACLEGKRITHIGRRAKYLLWRLDVGLLMVSHLGMSGKWLYYSAMPNQREVHTHLQLVLSDGGCLHYHDPRRFGYIGLMPPEGWEAHPWFASLGPEPLSDAWSGALLFERSRGRRQAIKPFLMDQKLVVGIGNIYACEALFRAGVHPARPAGALTLDECGAVVAASKAVLEEAIASGGSTLRDYVRSSGDTGYFQHHFAVYGRAGEACEICGNKILRLIQAGRSGFFCQNCQPEKVGSARQAALIK